MINLLKPAYAVVCNKALDPTCAATDPYVRTNSFIQLIITLLLIFIVIFFVYHFIMGAFRYITSEGDAKKVEQASDDILHSVVGVAIAFSVFAFLKLIGAVFQIPGLETLTLTWPTL